MSRQAVIPKNYKSTSFQEIQSGRKLKSLKSSRTWEASWPLTTSMVRWNKTVRPRQFETWRYGWNINDLPNGNGTSADRNRALYYCSIFFLEDPCLLLKYSTGRIHTTVGISYHFLLRTATRCNPPEDEKTTFSFPGKEPPIRFHLCHTVHGAVETLESQKLGKGNGDSLVACQNLREPTA